MKQFWKNLLLLTTVVSCSESMELEQVRAGEEINIGINEPVQPEIHIVIL